MDENGLPTFQDVLEARRVVSPYLAPTPLYHSPALSDLVGAHVYLKHEEYQPTGSFKVRGGINLLAHMPEDERRRGIITASTGNHGQSIAYACRLFGNRAIIGMPEGSNSLKVEAIRRLGAQVLSHGKVFDEARLYCERLVKEEGLKYVHPVNEPLLTAGVATETLEIVERLPDVEAIFLPLGGGTGAAGACIVAKAVPPGVRVIAVQSEHSPAGYLSWQSGKLVQAENTTVAEGLACGEAYELTQAILKKYLYDFVLVSDEELLNSVALLIEKAHTLAEAAGAASLAGALKLRETIQGKKVALVVSGGNITLQQLKHALQVYQESKR